MNDLDKQIQEAEERLAALKAQRGVHLALMYNGVEIEYKGYERVRIDREAFFLDRELNFVAEDEIQFPENEGDDCKVNQLGLVIDGVVKELIPIEREHVGFCDYPRFKLRVSREHES